MTRFFWSPGWHLSRSTCFSVLWVVSLACIKCHRNCLVTHTASNFSQLAGTKAPNPMLLLEFSVCNSCRTFCPSTRAAFLQPPLQAQWPLLHQPWLAHTPAVSVSRPGCPPPWRQESCVSTKWKSYQKQKTVERDSFYPPGYTTTPRQCYSKLCRWGWIVILVLLVTERQDEPFCWTNPSGKYILHIWAFSASSEELIQKLPSCVVDRSKEKFYTQRISRY